MVFQASTSVQISQPRIERLLRRPEGPVYRNMTRRLDRVEAAAIREAPGSMKAGIRSRVERGQRGEFRGIVRSTHPASIFVLNGTRPHRINPRRPGGVLRFTIGGRVVFARFVNHPGTEANPFLQRALRQAL